MAREFVTPVRFAVVSVLPSAASSTGHVLEQGGKLWYSDGATWADLGATGGASAGWTVATGATTMVAGTKYLAVITANTDFTLPTPAAGDAFIVSNSKDSTAGALVRVVVGGSRQVNGLPTGDNVTIQPGETLSLVARNATDLDILTPGATAGVASTAVATAAVNFGAAPGDTSVSFTVTDDRITATSKVEFWLYGSTADHNAYEHAIVPMRFGVESITAGVSFVARATSEWFLTGTFNVAYRIST